MGYLIISDYKKSIQADLLNQYTASDASILEACEATAIAEAKSYLVQKYDVNGELTETLPYDSNVIYKGNARVTSDNPVDNTLYFAKLPYPIFNYTANYGVGDMVFWKDKTYTCQIATGNPDQSQILQYGAIGNIPLQNIFPDAPNGSGLKYWGAGTAYSVPAATPLTDTSYWQRGDNRDQQLVTYIVSITLFYLNVRISPKQIPDIRVKAYDDAVKWLKMAAKGEVTPALPPLQPRQGMRIRFGGNIKNQNTY